MTHTTCGICGAIHVLGGIDCAGEPVGYIEAGCVWTSREERDESVGAGRMEEAFRAWNRAGGIGPAPNWERVLEAAGVLPEHRDAALESFQDAMRFYAMASPMRARAATLN